MADKTGALIAKCRSDACEYAWIIAFLPIDLKIAGNMGMWCRCPMCGDGRPSLGNEADLHPTLQEHLRAFTIPQENRRG